MRNTLCTYTEQYLELGKSILFIFIYIFNIKLEKIISLAKKTPPKNKIQISQQTERIVLLHIVKTYDQFLGSFCHTDIGIKTLMDSIAKHTLIFNVHRITIFY